MDYSEVHGKDVTTDRETPLLSPHNLILTVTYAKGVNNNFHHKPISGSAKCDVL